MVEFFYLTHNSLIYMNHSNGGKMKTPTIAITMGDPSGIGPELIVKILSDKDTYELCRPFVIGDPTVIGQTAEKIGEKISIKQIHDIAEAKFSSDSIDILCPSDLKVSQIQWGSVDPAMGKVSAVCIKTAFQMAVDNQIDGVVLAPMNKEAFHKAGFEYMDELEYIADMTKSPNTTVVGVVDAFWTVPVTGHITFRKIADGIKKDRILNCIRLLDVALKKIDTGSPKIAVAALNVHGGEGGLFGHEEMEEIGPAIEAAQKENINAQGPFPADTVFVTAMSQKFDGVVCMYHDQANIARKLLATRTGVTLFMGLPVPCATTAHGTAFDIAGRGVADPGSLLNALKYTAKLAG
jgi:4-hydroxythreonine-4-phosphate dehydrogenase